MFFTSGASESNNALIKGLAGFYGKERKHIITTRIEHRSTLEVCRLLEANGYQVTYLPVSENGLIDLSLLQKTIDNSREAVLCVSIILVNNEIGVKQNMKDIGKICKERAIFLHTDAGQAIGKIPIDVNEMNIDLLSISGHKIYGPKGIGAMFVRRKPRVRLTPLLNGGGQERGYRSGTLPPFLAVGMGKAC